jgi:hypothetical protein
MNKRQVILLWIIALVLAVAVFAVKISQNQTANSSIKRSPGQTLFEGFPAAQAASVAIQGASGTVTLTRKDSNWSIVERDAYPAKNSFVNDFLRTLSEVEVTQGMEAGPSFAPRFGMDESATAGADRGLTATIKDAEGKEIAKVSLGKTIESSNSSPNPMGGGSAVGRYIRNHADASAFYAVSELFPSITDDAKAWLNDGFISPEKIKTITVSQAGKAEPDWKVTRDGEEAEFKLDGASAAEVLDSTASTNLKSLLSFARFEDVVPKAKVAERATPESARNVVLETFDGFTYKLVLTQAKPAASEAVLLTVDVTAELAKERQKAPDEKPEDAKSKDSAFTERLKSLNEKLTREKALAGITFEISKSTVESLLKPRADLIAKPATDATATSNPVQQLPGGMIANPPSAPIQPVTPPVSIPNN